MKQLIILFIIAFLAGIVYYLTKKSSSKLYPVALLVGSGVMFAFLVPLSESNILLLDTIITNITPAMVFLYMLDLDYRKLLKNAIGCSCKMGAKRYWLLVLAAFVATFFAQLLALNITTEYSFLLAVFFAGVFGAIGHFTKLKEVNGSEDIATTMLYLLSVLVGMKIFLVGSTL